MHKVDRMRVDELDEGLLQIDVFSREGGQVDVAGDLLPELGVLPGHHVLEPGKLVRREGSAQANGVVDGEVAEVVGGQRDLVADGFTDGRDVLDKSFDRPVSELDRREGMGRHPVAGPVEPQRGGDQVPFPAQEVDPQVHLEERVSHVEAGLHPPGVLVTVA